LVVIVSTNPQCTGDPFDMIGLLAQERQILNQLVLLTKQSMVSGERLSQPM
jgi:hypothetical protein